MTLAATNLAFAYRPGTGAGHSGSRKTATDPASNHQPGRWVFEDLSASFEPGQVTAVLGPNGSGKSTLLRCLLGLLTPARGRVTLVRAPRASEGTPARGRVTPSSRSVHDLPEPERARSLAYIPQSPSAALGFTVADIVALGCGPRAPGPTARAAARRALESLDLADRADEPFNELSHGQQQRAVLARAIAQLDAARASGPTSPLALLADEPTSAMDPRHAVEALGHLRAQAALGCVVVVVLHDLTATLRAADRVLLLDERGRVAAAGTPEEALRPETLRRVFGLDFIRLTDEATGTTALVPAAAPPGR